MADPRTQFTGTSTGTFVLDPGLELLCRDAERLATTFPPPLIEKTGSWRPAPWDLSPASAWLARGMPSSVL
ncbi:hypothetical protein GCM10009547_37240 [Sporichthya brevicatena]|uniref:Uncharacterized protein n=1 Tax=Sporichthya brevicatena TaxID=171442 RepID=A0ABN1H684_9ACTN